MNFRERVLAMTLVTAVILAVGGFVFYQLFLGPLNAKAARIASAQEEIEKKQKELHQAQAEHVRLERFKQLSLPADVNRATREYETFLRSLFEKNGFDARAVDITVPPPDNKGPLLPGKKQAIYTTLQFGVDVTGKLEDLVRTLEGFYRTGLLHTIKNMTIEVPSVRDSDQRPDELKIKIGIDALAITGVDNRRSLLPNIDRRLVAIDAVTALRGGPTGLAWAGWALGPTGPQGPGLLATMGRKYTSIAGKNIFLGHEEKPEIIEITKFVFLTHIVQNDEYAAAYFYDRFNARERQLRNKPGLNQTTISDTSGDSFITVKAVQIDARDVIFSVRDRYYSMHVGQNLAEAMIEPLSEEQVEELIKDRAAASSKQRE